MQHKPQHCETGLWGNKNELDVTIRGFLILPLLYRTKDAFTGCTDTHRGRKRYRQDTIKECGQALKHLFEANTNIDKHRER